jgi:hypothetical protein
MITVYMNVDEFTTMFGEEQAQEYNEKYGTNLTAKDLEYQELEDKFREAFPEEEIKFYRDKLPKDLKNANPDYYIWDIGGMCVVDISGARRQLFTDDIVRQIEDHPNTWFIPNTLITCSSLRAALMDLMPEEDFEELKVPPNVVLFDRYDFEGLTAEKLKKYKK